MRGVMIERDFIDAPRIEVAIAPDDKGANVDMPSTLFDIWLVMHMPGEQPSMGDHDLRRSIRQKGSRGATFRIMDEPQQGGRAHVGGAAFVRAAQDDRLCLQTPTSSASLRTAKVSRLVLRGALLRTSNRPLKKSADEAVRI